MRRRLVLSAAFACTLLAACNAVPPADLKEPRLRFSDFRVDELGLNEIRFVLAIDTENPNSVAIPLRGIDFALDLLGEPFADGRVLDRTLTIPALGSRIIPVEFTVSTARLLNLARRARTSEPTEWSYRLSGSATWGWSGFPLRFERRGDLEVLTELGKLLQVPPSR